MSLSPSRGVVARWLTRLTHNQLEEVVENEPLAGGILGEVESLRVREGVFPLIDEKLAGHEDNDAAGSGRLRIQSADFVYNLLKGEARELLGDGVSAERLSALKSEHRVVPVERRQLRAVRVEGGVVVIDELLRNSLEVGHLY
jgi:hypothetical protein